ncbi:TPA: SPASM domain-containing protein [Streptococcus suis]|nr:SPASM domain-containing protein [Streptococcus suis]
MRQSILIKPVSSVCNIKCKYCFYEDVSNQRETVSFGKMSLDIARDIIDNLFSQLQDGDEVTIAFQGGEPTLAGLTFYERFIEYVKSKQRNILVNYSIQTNGIIINQKWCKFFKENDFLVGLSIDGTPMNHELNRLDMRGRGTFQRVMQTKNLFDQNNISYNVLCVLTNILAKDPKKVYRFIKKEKIGYVQFIPCLDSFEPSQKNRNALTPMRFATFYDAIFNLWLKDLKNGEYISIKLFDDIFNLFVYQTETACGLSGSCHLQNVIEADGSVYPCDFYALDIYKLGNMRTDSFDELDCSSQARNFLNEPVIFPSICHTCPYLNYCRMGCKRMVDAMYIDSNGYFCGYQSLLNRYLPNIEEIKKCIAYIDKIG